MVVGISPCFVSFYSDAIRHNCVNIIWHKDD